MSARWSALETLKMKLKRHFTIQTDVWSFGVTLWEIFSLCENPPYTTELAEEPSYDNLIEFLFSGQRLSRPNTALTDDCEY